MYNQLKEDFECKKYLYGVSNMGSKLLFRFRPGTHGLNEELGSICKEFISNLNGILQLSSKVII